MTLILRSKKLRCREIVFPRITQLWFQGFWLRRGRGAHRGPEPQGSLTAHLALQQVLSDSRFCGGLEVLAEWAPGLSHLRLSCNPIKDTGALKPLVRLRAMGQAGGQAGSWVQVGQVQRVPRSPCCPSQEKLKGLQNLELFGFEESQQLR